MDEEVDVKQGAPKEFFTNLYDGGPPPWDIGRPQRDLMAAFDALALTGGTALDVGCGTGEHVLELARRGVAATGLDSTPAAIDAARSKAAERGIDAEFTVGDALDLGALGRQFDVILDCGLFHVISEDDRRRYVEEVRAALVPGGVHVMLGFSINPYERGPRGYSEAELRAYFADGFVEQSMQTAEYQVNDQEVGPPALLSVFERAR